ncbi:DUF4328 domain-containing protein [Chitinophagaceae bacterium MMS25-I14]
MIAFKSTAIDARRTITVSFIYILVHVVILAIACNACIVLGNNDMASSFFSRQELFKKSNPDVLVNAINFIVLVVYVIVYSLWFYRAYKNAGLLAGGTRFKPGWTILFGIVPVLNCFLSFMVTREIVEKLNAVNGQHKIDRSVKTMILISQLSAIICTIFASIPFFMHEIQANVYFALHITNCVLAEATLVIGIVLIRKMQALEQKALLLPPEANSSIFKFDLQK